MSQSVPKTNSYAVQFVKRAGANVIAKASARDVDFARHLGANQVVDYQAERFEAAVSEADIVLDFVAGETQTRSLSVLKRGGQLVSAVSEPAHAIAGERDVAARFFLVAVDTAGLTRIAALFDESWLQHNVGAVFSSRRRASRSRDPRQVRGFPGENRAHGVIRGAP